MAFFNYSKYTGQQPEEEEKQKQGYFNYDKYRVSNEDIQRMTPNESSRRMAASKNEAAFSSRGITDADERLKRAGLPSQAELPKGVAVDFAVNNPNFTKAMLAISKPIRRTLEETKPGKFFTRSSETAGDLATFGASKSLRGEKTTTGSKGLDIAADITGDILGIAANPTGTGSLGNVMGLSGKASEKGFETLASKIPLLNKTGKAGRIFTQGAGMGTAYQSAKEIEEGKDKPILDRLADIGIMGGLFGAGDVALHGVGKLAKPQLDKLLARLKKAPDTTKLKEAAERLKPTEVPLKDAVGVQQPYSVLRNIPLASAKQSGQKTALLNDPLALVRKNAEPSISSSVAPVLQKAKPSSPSKDIPIQGTESKFGINPIRMKDISGAATYGDDVYRIFKNVTGRDYPAVKEKVLDPFDAAKKTYTDQQKTWTDKLKTEVVDKLGITKGSKLSALVQQYGEKEISLDSLKGLTKDWEKVVEADKWFRESYDTLLDQVNATRAKIYPNNPEKIVPKRNDYYRHFQEFTGLTGLKNIFDTPAQISPKLVGTSEFTLPKSKFQGFMQKRGLGPFKRDAVGGFLEYLPGASYATHIDPHIEVFKGITKELRETTEDTKHLNGFINYLDKFSQDLAGKTNPGDRWLQERFSRTAFSALNWLNNRVKANVILGNAGSTLAQLANIPVGAAFAKQHSLQGVRLTLKSLMPGMENKALEQSGFMSERYARRFYRQFDTKLIEQPKRLAEWLMETTERIGTEFVWNSAYTKGAAEKVKNPVKYADDETRRLIAGRGIGEVPLAQKAKVTQLFLPFTLEVANLWKVQKDFINAKDFGGLIGLYMGAYLLNKGMEATRGSGILFDPIDAIADAATAEDVTPVQRAGILAGEVLTNMPLGGMLTDQLYPEYGKTLDVPLVGKVDLPTRQELFGNNDPTRFGSGVLNVSKGIQDPLFKLLLPWGGNQLNKTIQGLEANQKGAVYTKNEDQVMYPVEDDAYSRIQNVLFGKYSTPEAREYFEKNRMPLTEKQTLQFEKASDPRKIYDNVLKQRKVDKVRRAIDNIKKSRDMGREEKKRKLDQLIEKLRAAKKE